MIRRELLLFSIAGTLGFLVDVSVLYSLLALGSGFYSGRVASFLLAAFTTWQFNRRWTFPSREPPASGWSEWMRYLYAMTLGAAINYAAYVATLHFAPMAWWLPMLGVAAGSACGLLVNFLLARQWVFKPR